MRMVNYLKMRKQRTKKIVKMRQECTFFLAFCSIFYYGFSFYWRVSMFLASRVVSSILVSLFFQNLYFAIFIGRNGCSD